MGFDSFRESPPPSDAIANTNTNAIAAAAANVAVDALLPDRASENVTAGCIAYPGAVALALWTRAGTLDRITIGMACIYIFVRAVLGSLIWGSTASAVVKTWTS